MAKEKELLKKLVIKQYLDYNSDKKWERGELTKRILQKLKEFDTELIKSKYPKDIINRYIRNFKKPTLKQLSEEIKDLNETVKKLREEVKDLNTIVQHIQQK